MKFLRRGLKGGFGRGGLRGLKVASQAFLILAGGGGGGGGGLRGLRRGA